MTASRSAPIRKIFVVGCPRSGTTVTQSILAGLPGVMSMGETEYMLTLFGRFEGWLREDPDAPRTWHRRMGVTRGTMGRRLQACMDRAFGDRAHAPRLRHRFTGRGYIAEFCRVLDQRARENACTCWVEKTPDHLPYVDVMAERIPDAHFLHVVRRGEDVIASAIEGQMRFAEHNVFYGTLPYWILRWNRAVQWHIEHAGRPGHTVLPYECLFGATGQVRGLLARLAGVEVPTTVTRNTEQDIADLSDEPWKHGSTDGVLRKPESKVEQMFGPRLRGMLHERLDDYAGVVAQIARRQPQLPWIACADDAL